MSWPAFGTPDYGITVTMREGVSFADSVSLVREALASEGFGVLTEIDVQATMKKKLDADTAPYLILGACNPQLAYQALNAESAIGLLLPCNVVVAQGADDRVTVSMANPEKLFELVDRADIAQVAGEVGAKVRRVIARLS